MQAQSQAVTESQLGSPTQRQDPTPPLPSPIHEAFAQAIALGEEPAAATRRIFRHKTDATAEKKATAAKTDGYKMADQTEAKGNQKADQWESSVNDKADQVELTAKNRTDEMIKQAKAKADAATK